jgi:hypothetical protein
VFDAEGNWTGDFNADEPLVVTLNGTTDLYNPWTGEIYDAKTMACAAAAKFIRGEMKPAWEVQTNIYAWLASRTVLPPDFHAYCDEHGLPRLPGPTFPYPTHVRIQGISMMELPQTGRAYKPLRDSRIRDIPDLQLWPADDVETFVRARALEWFKVLVLGERAPVVSKKNAWLCAKCSFNGERIPGERCFPSAER